MNSKWDLLYRLYADTVIFSVCNEVYLYRNHSWRYSMSGLLFVDCQTFFSIVIISSMV
jgi:hypothetical protein